MAAPLGLFVGLTTLDVVQLVDEWPGRDQKSTARQTWVAAGGPAAVAAITFAALGGQARLWTALGNGPAARIASEDLRSAGVEVIDAAPAGFELGASTVWVDAATGARAVMSGSANHPPLLDQPPCSLVGVDVVLVDGHHPGLALAAAWGRQGTVPLVVDAGSAKPVYQEVFRLATDVICAASFVGLAPREVLSAGVDLVAVSRGADDLLWWTSTGTGRIKVAPVDWVDTLGAGDVLHGAYCHRLTQGLGRVEALESAVLVATERVRHPGPFEWRARISGI